MVEPNVLLDALIEEAGFSHAGFAARVNQHGRQRGIELHYDHASVARWLRDHAIPRGLVPEIVCEILGSRLGRAVTLLAAGLDRTGGDPTPEVPLSQAINRAAAFWRSDAKRAPAAEGKHVLGALTPLRPSLNGKTRQTITMWPAVRGTGWLPLLTW